MRKTKICFVCSGVYHLLKKTSQDSIGGAQLQQLLIGKELLKRGYEVTFIVEKHGEEDSEYIDGFRVVSTFKENAGIPGFRFFYPRLPKIWNALTQADADIYYVRCAGFMTAVVARYAQLNNKKIVYCGAHDNNFQPSLIKLPTIRDKVMHLWGIKRCDKIFVQNQKQKEDLSKNFGIEGTIVHNGMPTVEHKDQRHLITLWVANIKIWKQPKYFIELAKRFPNEQFVMIGGRVPKQEALFDYVVQEAQRCPNLTFKQFLPFGQTEKYFARAKLFMNTSIMEGFPNTFLQAWRRGIPVLSFVNPDDLINQYQLGSVARGFHDMIIKAGKYYSREMNFSSSAIRKVFEENFTIAKMADQYHEAFQGLLDIDKKKWYVPTSKAVTSQYENVS